jgi:rhomboid protease GluP
MNDTLDESPPAAAEELLEVGEYPSLDQAHEHGLVVLAMRQPCLVAPAERPGHFTLHADPLAAPAVVREIEAYENEKDAPAKTEPKEREWFRHRAGWDVYLIWLLALVACFIWQNRDPALADIAASSGKGLLERHEWWRPFTGLFLHADVPHLLGNLLSGLFFGTLVARSIGPWRGWALILACGTVGNLLTSLITRPDPFVSIGASTAVFGALGILSGLGFIGMLRQRARLPWARIAAPVLAGVVLLGWLGGGREGGNTDVLGHVFGFASGLAAGVLVAEKRIDTA